MWKISGECGTRTGHLITVKYISARWMSV